VSVCEWVCVCQCVHACLCVSFVCLWTPLPIILVWQRARDGFELKLNSSDTWHSYWSEQEHILFYWAPWHCADWTPLQLYTSYHNIIWSLSTLRFAWLPLDYNIITLLTGLPLGWTPLTGLPLTALPYWHCTDWTPLGLYYSFPHTTMPFEVYLLCALPDHRYASLMLENTEPVCPQSEHEFCCLFLCLFTRQA